MNEALLFLLPALIACIVLVAIHSYLGIHVLERGIIFVDIALAQIAALGLTTALYLGYEPESLSAYFFALGASSFGALLFTFFRSEKISQEVIIAISFALSSALSLILSEQSPHGTEHIKYILSGNILWVTWPQLIKTFCIYSFIGIIHYYFRKPLWEASQSYKLKSKAENKRWDFLFYFSFALVITSSVQLGGILLVFSFLIIPAALSQLFCQSGIKRLILGWVIGLVTSCSGIALSYLFDYPPGPAIVCLFGLFFFLALGFKSLFK